MTLDDRLAPISKNAEDWIHDQLDGTSMVEENLTAVANDSKEAKQAILSDLEKLIEDNCIYGNEQENKAELLKEVRKYCE